MVCHYSYFFCGFKFQNFAFNGCHDSTVMYPNLIDVAIITVEDVNYCYVIYDIAKSKAIHLLENSLLEDRGCI